MVRWRYPGVLAVVALAAAALAACSTTPTAATDANDSSGKITVVAAENVWGNIAKQLGGDHVNLTTIVSNPNTNPRSYTPSPADTATMTSARLVILNGIGYDTWATNLLAANPDSERSVLTVGDLLGMGQVGIPYRWYSPGNVNQVVNQITADYEQMDPVNAPYFYQLRQTFEAKSLTQYNQLIIDIKAKYTGTPIGASASVVTPLAQWLGLTLLTPETFLDAVSAGGQPTEADKATIEDQIKTKKIKIYVFDSQSATPDVQAQVKEAKAARIPVVPVTEAIDPATATFQDWQVAGLKGIEAALARAPGKR